MPVSVMVAWSRVGTYEPVADIPTRPNDTPSRPPTARPTRCRNAIVLPLMVTVFSLSHVAFLLVLRLKDAPDRACGAGLVLFLAYHIAVRRGADVDQPRNLAKSVTVE